MKSLSVLKSILRTAMLSLVLVSAAHAADVGTPAEAEALVKKAVALIKAVGPEKAYDEITNGKSLKDRDLYVAVNDLNGKNLAHGGNPKMVGKDLLGLKDSDGNFPSQMMIAIAKEKGKGWTGEYKAMNPLTQKVQAKIAYVERVGDTLVVSGAYKN